MFYAGNVRWQPNGEQGMTEGKKRVRGKRRATKDRVLQARIPEKLDDELRDRAEQLGLSVSTIVRNALLHTFELVEGVVTDSAQLSRAIQGRAIQSKPELPAPMTVPPATEPEILGWQEVILNLNGICDKCNAILHKGERAAVSLPSQPRPVLLCTDCLLDLSAQSPAKKKEAKPSSAATGRGRKPRK